MRSLGYPRIISVENFRNPNFELVADCLDWLVQRFDESADIDDDISTEERTGEARRTSVARSKVGTKCFSQLNILSEL